MRPNSNLELAAEPPQPQRTPERQRLADAIEARTASEEALAAVRRTVTRATDMVAKAERRLEAAHEALTAAGAERALALAEAAATDVPATAGGMRQARLAVHDAEDEAESARAAVAALQRRLGDAEDTLRAAQATAVAAADIVLRSEARRVLAEACAAAEALRRCRTLLLYFQRPEAAGLIPHIGIQKPAIGEDWTYSVREFGTERASRRAAADREAMRLRDEGFAGETEAAVRRELDLTLGEIHKSDKTWWSSPDLGPWREAREALMTDADAVLPGD
jgi:hypothetical protein